jgi:response regulator RpfG family c-di-GMP phosphodiesterase
VAAAITKLLSKSNPLTLRSLKARQLELEKRMKDFGKTGDPDTIWLKLGIKDVAEASLATAPEFIALAKKK